MTRDRAIARIRWRSHSEGGRVDLPSGSSYVTIAAFDPPTPGWPEEAWSLVVEPVRPDDWPQEGEFFVGFLRREAAPQEVLVHGTTFHLLEGKRIVAEGEILNRIEQGSTH